MHRIPLFKVAKKEKWQEVNSLLFGEAYLRVSSPQNETVTNYKIKKYLNHMYSVIMISLLEPVIMNTLQEVERVQKYSTQVKVPLHNWNFT